MLPQKCRVLFPEARNSLADYNSSKSADTCITDIEHMHLSGWGLPKHFSPPCPRRHRLETAFSSNVAAAYIEHVQISGTANHKEGSWYYLKPQRQTKFLLSPEHNHGGTQNQKYNLYLVRNLKEPFCKSKQETAYTSDVTNSKLSSSLFTIFCYLSKTTQSRRILVLFSLKMRTAVRYFIRFSFSLSLQKTEKPKE